MTPRLVEGPAPPGRTLVVVGGLPGAGKTTLLRRAAVGPGVLSLDAEDVASALSHVPVTYRVVRPLVHATHLLRVARACWADAPCVATTDPLTSPARQVLLRTAARWSGRELLVVLLHVAPEQARDGQRRRGRLLSERRVRRHERRYARRWGARPGADVRSVLTREQARRVRDLTDVLGCADRRTPPDVVLSDLTGPAQPPPTSDAFGRRLVPDLPAGRLRERSTL